MMGVLDVAMDSCPTYLIQQREEVKHTISYKLQGNDFEPPSIME